MTTPTPEAIEAAAIAFYVAVQPNHRKPEDWADVRGVWKKSYRDQARAALTAAAPFMTVEAQILTAQAKGEALREAADAYAKFADHITTPRTLIGDASYNATNHAARWLRARAATIEGKSE